ncbi:MAG: [2Fe-2S]-binding protein [Gemmatimonadetes bacterium]|nr:[2Fe-2S]-binding protein [Gemmatimonadota bacterium]
MQPPNIGDIAPDFVLSTGRWLSDVRGAPVILAFHEPGWDPARADEIEGYRHLIQAGEEPQRVLVSNDEPAAALYGAARESAVFVLDGRGRIAWRHVAGIDPVESAAEIAALGLQTNGDGVRTAWSRRGFVATAIGAAVALTLEPTFGRAQTAAAQLPSGGTTTGAAVGDAVPVTLNVNGQTITLNLEPRVTLLDALREYAGLTGSKKGCDHGQCGACTVHIDRRRTLSCLTFAVMQQDKKITTIEGLAASAGATGDSLHPMQQAFIEHDGFQCGYCTSGQIMSATAMVGEPWGPGDDDVREAMSGNICRCGAYPGIVAAVQEVRRNGGGQGR